MSDRENTCQMLQYLGVGIMLVGAVHGGMILICDIGLLLTLGGWGLWASRRLENGRHGRGSGSIGHIQTGHHQHAEAGSSSADDARSSFPQPDASKPPLAVRV